MYLLFVLHKLFGFNYVFVPVSDMTYRIKRYIENSQGNCLYKSDGLWYPLDWSVSIKVF